MRKLVGIYSCSEPEFVGRFPARQDLSVLPADLASRLDVPKTPLQVSHLYECSECGKFLSTGQVHTDEECVVRLVLES